MNPLDTFSNSLNTPETGTLEYGQKSTPGGVETGLVKRLIRYKLKDCLDATGRLREPSPTFISPPGGGPEGEWEGQPCRIHGVVRHLAFAARKQSGKSYARVQFAEAGRYGDPWGGLHLEVDGNLYHFNAGLKRFPELLSKNGRDVTDEGVRKLASGLPGNMAFDSLDWRWVQDELDITSLLTEEGITQLHAHFENFRKGTLPKFQARIHAHRLKIPLSADGHNCTTIIVSALNAHLQPDMRLNECYPLNAFRALSKAVSSLPHKPQPDAVELALKALLSLPIGNLKRALKYAFRENCAAQNPPAFKTLAKGSLHDLPSEVDLTTVLKYATAYLGLPRM